MSRQPLDFALVGAGSIAQTYAQVLLESEEARIVAVADSRREAARGLAERLGCRSFSSYDALSEARRYDAVLVCTPPSSHAEICLHFLERRTAVLCETPFSVDLIDARAMVEQARSSGVILTMASKFRYVADVIQGKRIVDGGTLGEIVLFENTFASRVDMSSRWNADPGVSGGGVLIDNAAHSVDLIRYFLGPITEVYALEGKRIQELPVEDTVRLLVRSGDGVVGTVDLSWSIDKRLESYVDIYGTHGTLRIGWKNSKFRPDSTTEWIPFGTGYNKTDAFRRQIEDFCGALRGEEDSLVTAEDSIASVEVIEAAYGSLELNTWVPVGFRWPELALHPARL